MRRKWILFWIGLISLVAAGLIGSTTASGATTCANRLLEDSSQVWEREIAVLCETNNFRRRKGKSPLKLDPVLSEVARAHAKDMVERGYFDHDNKDGLSPFDRMRASAYGTFKSAGENIAYGYRTPQDVVVGWINSDGHRNNMLADRIDIGIGIYDFHYVQLFAAPGAGRDGITGLEPGYQGSPGLNPWTGIDLFGKRVRGETSSPAPILIAATRKSDGRVTTFTVRHDEVIPMKLGPGVWKLCWSQEAASKYASGSGCLAGHYRVFAKSGFALKRTAKRKFRFIPGAAVGQQVTITTRYRKRSCRRWHGKRVCYQAWSRAKRRIVTVADQRIRIVTGDRKAKVRFAMRGFEIDGVPYKGFSRIIDLR